MRRIKIDGKAWFDADAAQSWEETTTWDGHNRISDATGSQWRHETLYLTAKGAWVIDGYSQYQGSPNWTNMVTPKEAYGWLLRCDYEIPEVLTQFDAEAEV